MKIENLSKGILLMLLSSLMACVGQLMWKLSAIEEQKIIFLVIGFILYGAGALCMIIALRFGEVSVLQPMLCVGFIISIILGAVVLNEVISLYKIIGIFLIAVGMVFLSRSSSMKRKN